jgi:hypothetical protein
MDNGIETYEEWKARILKDYGRDPTSWRPLGTDWLCARKDNSTYTQVVYHLCEGNRLNSAAPPDLALDKCTACEEPTPEGIRMIALLEEL